MFKFVLSSNVYIDLYELKKLVQQAHKKKKINNCNRLNSHFLILSRRSVENYSCGMRVLLREICPNSFRLLNLDLNLSEANGYVRI